MPRKPKMPQYAGLLLEDGKFCGPIYKVTMQIAPDKFGISRDATNEEMLRGFLECVTSAAKDAAAAARAEGEAAGYRRAIDEACAAIEAEHRQALEEHRKQSDHEWRSANYGRLSALREVESVVRALAPVEPVSKADELPAKEGV